MFSFIRKHPYGVGAGAAALIAGLAWLAFGFFGVHLLFIDDVVDEAGPVFDAQPAALEADTATAPPPTAPAGGAAETDAGAGDATADDTADTPDSADTGDTDETDTDDAAGTDSDGAAAPEVVTEFVGTFQSDAHPTSGTATVLGNGTGQRFLRFEDFETDNGPDLNVYLVNSSTGDVSDYVDLGDLKGNIGSQNYEIPADVDLTVYDQVVIWCVRFGVGFGDALIMPA